MKNEPDPFSFRRLFYWNWKHLDFLGPMMSRDIRVLFEEFKNAPFPELGKVVGDFVLYDSLIAGTVSSFIHGVKIDVEAIPVPDKKTAEMLKGLKKKPKLDGLEAEFVKYAQLLEELREEVTKALKAGRRENR